MRHALPSPAALALTGILPLMTPSPLHAAAFDGPPHTAAAEAVNALAADLFPLAAKTQEGSNALISPYSIAAAMGMASAGASGETLAEMRRVLRHGEADEERLHASFSALAAALRRSAEESRKQAARAAEQGRPADGVSFSIANRLFTEQTRPVLPDFASFLLAHHGAAPEPLDFLNAPEASRARINEWVAAETLNRIRDLIPPQGITRDTALVIANAIHFKASWESPFSKISTRPGPFQLPGGSAVEVPMMREKLHASCERADGRVLLALPYTGRDFFFTILMPDAVSAAASEADVSALVEAASKPVMEIALAMPKFRIEPSTLPLGAAFKELGMARAFDIPRGSADFSRISPKKPDDYVFISEIFHKTFLELDEDGTEAAAATAVGMISATMIPAEPPPVVVIDRPFLFGIVHRPTGLLLFAGRCADPR